MTTTRTRRHRCIAVVAAGAALGLTPIAAHAASILTLTHDAVGTSYIKKTKSTVALKPTTLTTHLDLDTGAITGSLPLPATSTEFKVAGLVPVTANVDFVPVGDVTGSIDLNGALATVDATAKYYVKLSNVKILGLPGFAGNACQTKVPVTIPVSTPAGEGFDLIGGGNLTGTYTIGAFTSCGINTGLINLLVPGPGNTVNIQAADGAVQE